MTPRVHLIYRNRNYGKPGTRTLGLGVNAMHTVRVLNEAGIAASASGVWEEKDLSIPPGTTHAIIEAPWVSVEKTLSLAGDNPATKIHLRCHSNLAFLQVEPNAIALMREIVLYGEATSNLKLALNSEPLAAHFNACYHADVAYLPNLYHFDRPSLRPRSAPGSLLKAASFGAVRLQKNHITGAAAALALARKLGRDLEFHLMLDSGGSGTAEVVQAIKNLFTGLSWAKVVTHGWEPWPIFRRIVMEMDIAFHLTSTETFSLSTADCLAEGVPVIASPMIGWLPAGWIVSNTDDPGQAARLAEAVLDDHRSAERGRVALQSICWTNLKSWQDYLAH